MALLQDRTKAAKPDARTDSDGVALPTKKERRKAYLDGRKRKRKGGRGSAAAAADDDGYDSATDTGKRGPDGEEDASFVTGERAVSFLDRADRPPVFHQLPRGALVTKKVKAVGGGGSDEVKIRRDQNAMEAMRKRVVAQYAVVKARRRMEHEARS